MNELKFVNKKHTLEELKELLNIGDRKKYKLFRYYSSPYNSVIGDYEMEYFYGYPDKYLDLPVISYLIKENLITIIVYGGVK